MGRTKVRELILRPNGTFTERNSTAVGRALVHHRDKEAKIINEGDIDVNGIPQRFESWEAFLKAEDPQVVEPKRVSAFSFITGDNPSLCVSSEEEQWAQPRDTVPPLYTDVQSNRDMVLDHAFSDNAASKASSEDNQAVSTVFMLVLAFVSVVAVVIFGGVILGKSL